LIASKLAVGSPMYPSPTTHIFLSMYAPTFFQY
jgi:hypothetical protein